jgi:hypothetical protein
MYYLKKIGWERGVKFLLASWGLNFPETSVSKMEEEGKGPLKKLDNMPPFC